MAAYDGAVPHDTLGCLLSCDQIDCHPASQAEIFVSVFWNGHYTRRAEVTGLCRGWLEDRSLQVYLRAGGLSL